MNEQHLKDTIPIPRHRVFVLSDGKFVVQWEENRVQDLLTGRYHAFSSTTDTNPINDFELNQLRSTGVVQDYTEDLIHLSSEPVIGHFPTRTYYLNTTLPRHRREEVEQCLKEQLLSERFAVRVQQRFVIVRGPGGIPFRSFDAAEKAREQLISEVPTLFKETVVAFLEIIESP